jgi:hypothetical protein
MAQETKPTWRVLVAGPVSIALALALSACGSSPYSDSAGHDVHLTDSDHDSGDLAIEDTDRHTDLLDCRVEALVRAVPRVP